MDKKLSKTELLEIRNSSDRTFVELVLLSHVDALEEEIEQYKMQEQIHLNRLKIVENKGGHRNAR